MEKRKIIHIDMDSFFASVEIRDNPKLKGCPVAVGGSAEGRGVLSTANYEARKFGVHSAMPTKTALKLCPHLILVPHHFEKYKKVSREVFKIFADYTSVIEPASLDEAYLDVTDSLVHQGCATKIASEIRSRVFMETGLTCSAGISYNKLLAKIASEWHKPNGQWTITPWSAADLIKNLSVRKINGVGKVTAAKMEQLSVYTFEDLQRFDQAQLTSVFGRFGHHLYNYARGIDHRKVASRPLRKSLSLENTFSEDLNINQARSYIPNLYQELLWRLEKHRERTVKCIFVKIKSAEFKTTTIESGELSVEEQSFVKLFNVKTNGDFEKIRLLGIGVRFVFEQSREGQLELPIDYSHYC